MTGLLHRHIFDATSFQHSFENLRPVSGLFALFSPSTMLSVCFWLQIPLPESGLCVLVATWACCCFPGGFLQLSSEGLCIPDLFISLREISWCRLLHPCVTVFGPLWGCAEASPLCAHLHLLFRQWSQNLGASLSCWFWINRIMDACSFYFSLKMPPPLPYSVWFFWVK